MNIASVDYTLNYQSIDIYVSGCKGPHCEGCHNVETWDFKMGVPYGDDVIKVIENKISRFPDMVKRIMIFGGEPLDQDPQEFLLFLDDLEKFKLPIWLFTRYDVTLIPETVKQRVEYIKTGEYVKSLECKGNIHYGIELSTSNQVILKKGVDF